MWKMSLLSAVGALITLVSEARAMPNHPMPNEVVRFFESTTQPACAMVGVRDDAVFHESFFIKMGDQPSALEFTFKSLDSFGEHFDDAFEINRSGDFETLSIAFHKETCFELPFRECSEATAVERFEITISKDAGNQQIVFVKFVEKIRKESFWSPGRLRKEWKRLNPDGVCKQS